MELRPAQSGLRFGDLVNLFDDAARAGTSGSATSAEQFVRGIAVDSRHAQPGDMFAALSGVNVHGAVFVPDALAAGAVALLTDREGLELMSELITNDGPAVLVLDNPRAAVGIAAAEIYGRPGDGLLLLGVTGTNGKTTTTWMLEHALRRWGHTTGLIGTVETQIAGEAVESVRTTPEAPELHALLAVMRERGVTAVAIEVSSHAMTMGRVDGCLFDAVGFTQFGVDHLDFHETEENYFQAKRSLFDRKYSKLAVVCTDSEGGQRLLREIEQANHDEPNLALPVVTVSTSRQSDPKAPADWQAAVVQRRESGGYGFQVTAPIGTAGATLAVPGYFNIGNALVAAAMLDSVGATPPGAERPDVSWLTEFRGVPGRMESVDVGQAFVAIVDYAHTPDALAAVLDTLRRETSGRLLIAFGCGGDRDPSKRAAMGQVAATLADEVVITDDNPRSEGAATIRAEVVRGAEGAAHVSQARVTEVAGRRSALEVLVAAAQPGDIVVVAGKGHEHGQEVDGHVEPFDDRVELAAALTDRLSGTTQINGPQSQGSAK